MKSVLASLALFALSALAQGNSSSPLTINTPSNVVECEPTLLSWSGGTAPYFLSVLSGNNPTGAAIESFPETNATSYTWTVNIQSGTYIGFTLRDSTGATAQTAPVTIASGSSTSCANITSVAGGSAPTSAAATSTAVTTAAVISAGATTAAASSASASPSSGSSSSSGASANAAQLGVAGIAGVAIAAFFL